MKYHFLLYILLASVLFFDRLQAQYVTIPDTAFVAWLDSNGFNTCMNGNQLDTNCSALLSATGISCTGVPVRNLTGIQYFKSLYFLNCAADSLTYIPALPAALGEFDCQSNKLASLPALPTGLTNLTCSYNLLTSLPDLPATLITLSCNNNQLTGLPALPAHLEDLSCDYNQLTSLPPVSPSLQGLNCGFNPQLACLPQLYNMSYINFDSTAISCLPDYFSVNSSVPPLDTIPLCGTTGSSCPSFTGITLVTEKININIYPNPAKNYVTVETDANAIGGTLQITDITGRPVFQSAISNQQSEIPTNALSAGVYLVHINDLNGRTAVGKLVVE